MENAYEILRKILGIYALLLILIGTLTSILGCYICFKLRNTTTFTFFFYLSIVSIFTLYFWNLGNFLRELLGIDLINVNFWLCKFGSFYQFTSLQIAAWILVLISIDQFLSIKVKHWRSVHFKPKRAFIAATLLVVFLILFNLNILVLFGYENINANSTEVICYEHPLYPSTKWMTTWGRVHLMMYSVIPFVTLLVTNSAFVIFLYKKKRVATNTRNLDLIINKNSRSANKIQSINVTIMVMTFLFIAMTLPCAFASFYFNELIVSDLGYFFIVLSNCISFSYHGLNCILYYFSNRRFRYEFLTFFGIKNTSYKNTTITNSITKTQSNFN